MPIKSRPPKSLNTSRKIHADKEPRIRVSDAEQSFYESTYYDDSQRAPYNPDALVAKKGGLDIYKSMLDDDQVKACVTMKKYAIISSGYTIDAASEEKADQEAKEFVEYALGDGLPGTFQQNLLDILSALSYGFSCSEMVYKYYDPGQSDFPGKIGLQAIKTRPPHSFEFDTDERGNLKKLLQHGPKGDVELDPAKMIIMSYNAEFGNWYGTSDLKAAYRSYFAKDMLIKFWNIFLERFGMPPVIGWYPRGATEAEQKALFKIIKNFQAKNAIKLAEGFKIELLEAVRQGTAGYEAAIDKHNIMIARALLLPDLLGFSGSSKDVGSFALGQKHFDIFTMILANLRENLEALILDQLIRPLVAMNYNVKNFPKLKFKPLTEENKSDILKLWFDAVDKGVVKVQENDEAHVREVLKFPEIDENDEGRQEKPPVPPVVPPIPGQTLPEPGKPGQVPPLPEPPEPKPGKKEFKLHRALTPYEKKCNFAEINDSLDTIELDMAQKLGAVVKDIKDDVLYNVVKNKIIEDKDASQIGKINLKYLMRFRMIVKDYLRTSYMEGRRHAKAEVNKKKYAEVTIGNLPPKEALKYLESKAVWVTDLAERNILDKVKTILYDGIRAGKAQEDVIFSLEEYFEGYKVLQTAPDGTIKAIEEIPGRLATVVRNNVSDAYNQGRLNMFQDPTVKDFVGAYQYSAILDATTTVFCEKMDGRIYKANDPIWAKLLPPNHHGCRSIIVVILNDEEYTVDQHLAIQPDEGFGK